MQFKIKKPTTPSQRHLIKFNTTYLRKKPFIKQKIKGLIQLSGRNHSGKITVRHKGGGHKKKFREINFCRNKSSIEICCTIEYDPNRNSFIASIYNFQTNKFSYILAPKNLKIGDIVESGPNAKPKLGHSLPLLKIPVGSFIHNISTKEYKIAEISRSAGTFSKIKEKIKNNTIVELSSGKTKVIPSKCYATIGIVSNDLAFLSQLGKAGHSRWLNKRPSVRGVAMNPIDHPHGGGEGKKSGKNKTPWGKPNNKKRK